MKKILLTIAALATLFSCSSIDEMAGDKYAAGDYVESVEMTVEDFEEDATTRTALSNLTDTGAKFAWAENDTVGIFPNVGDQVSFSMSAGAGTSSATFNGGGWALRTSSSYSAYYPFSRANFYRNSKTIAINMVGQTQNGNDDTSEIGAFDIMAAAPASAETGNVKFAFKHQVSICRIKLTLPENKSFKSVKVIAPSKKFITEAKLDISVATPTITATKTSEEISLSLRNFSTTSTNKNLVANMYVLPVDMSADKLTVEVTDVDDNVYTAENVAGVNFEKAKIRILNAAPTAPGGDGEGEGEDFTGDDAELSKPLSFTALYNGTISLENTNNNAPNIEYSFDGETWTNWDYSAITIKKDETISFRGDNPDGFSNGSSWSSFKISMPGGGPISASGNIMSLLSKNNFAANKTIPCPSCFQYLFFECYLSQPPLLPATTLTPDCYYGMFCFGGLDKAPILPAMTLAKSCYGEMFSSCYLGEIPVLPAVNLAPYCYEMMFLENDMEKAPILPATTLAEGCYQAMFNCCGYLKEAPVLPATTLADYCYADMFEFCRSLTQAPDLPATTLAKGCYSGMFKYCDNLKSVKAAFLTKDSDNDWWLSDSGYGYWLSGVSSTGVFYKSKYARWNNSDVVPSGWSVVEYLP
ncbi:MAG: fimbrillin family protein [Bacteroidales bacterium]|nr:fimbrillin family protein [Bacteroidales bacterium]